MPKVLLTKKQREEDRNRRQRNAIADGLAVTRRRTGLTMEELGREAGVGRNTMSKILAGEDVVIPVSAALRLLELAGMSLKKRTEDLEGRA